MEDERLSTDSEKLSIEAAKNKVRKLYTSSMTWEKISKEEALFFHNAAKRRINSVNDLCKQYRLAFPGSTRTDSGIRSQIHLARKGIYAYKELGPITEIIPKRGYTWKKATKSPIASINVSKVTATPIDNIIVDLIDAISALKAENKMLKDQVDSTTKQLQTLNAAANTLDAIKTALRNMKEDI